MNGMPHKNRPSPSTAAPGFCLASNAAAILPADLLLSILALSTPLTPAKAAICQEVAYLSRTSLLRYTWTQSLILHHPIPASLADQEWGRYCTNHTSRLADCLTFRLDHWLPEKRELDEYDQLPPPGIAPLRPILEPLISLNFLRWLFASPCGPLKVNVPFTEVEFKAQMQLFANASLERLPLHSSSGAIPRWSFIPDAFRLLSYFSQLGDCDSVAFILSQITRAIDPKFFVPSWMCLQLSVDKRVDDAHIKNKKYRTAAENEETMSIEQWMYWTILLEWSPALLNVANSVLGNNLSCMRDILHRDANSPASRHSPIYVLVVTFGSSGNNPDRFLPIFDALEQHKIVLHPLSLWFIDQKIDQYQSISALVHRFPPPASADHSEDDDDAPYAIYGQALFMAGKHGDMDTFRTLLASNLWQFVHVCEGMHAAVTCGCDEAVEMVHEYIDERSMRRVLINLLDPMSSKSIQTAGCFTDILNTLDPSALLLVVKASVIGLTPRVIKNPGQAPLALDTAWVGLRHLWQTSLWSYRVWVVAFAAMCGLSRVYWLGVRWYHCGAVLAGAVAVWMYA